jgi:transcription-repair coupling factor (superfamily II helicase)
MSLAGILSIVADDPRLREAFEIGAASTPLPAADAEPGAGPAGLEGLDLVAPPALRPVLTAAIAARLGRFVLAVTATAREAEDLTAALGSFLPANSVACFPGWETLPHERLSPR